MKKRKIFVILLIFACTMSLIVPPGAYSQTNQGGAKPFKPEEIGQLVAPIALYPDSLVAQILMASTYPLEIVQAYRWAQQNKSLKGDALAAALEKQTWDPSVKSLVNFPDVLKMMNDKVDWTQKLGDAVLAQQGDVLDTIQSLRTKAKAQGTLQTTKEQTVKVEEKVIVIEPTNPNYVYVPAYNPTVVYGAWPYPAYPPSTYYPPGYVAGAAFAFTAGVALTAAWGYAWGNCNWGSHSMHYDVNANINRNTNINRSAYAGKTGQGGSWQHNPQNRKGVAYRDPGTAQRYNKGGTGQGIQDRQAYRGRNGQAPGGTGRPSGGDQRPQAGTSDRGGKDRPDRPSAMDRGGQNRPTTADRGQQSAFGDMERGSDARRQSDRGSASRQEMASSRGSFDRSSGMSRGSGGGGVSRGGGGGRGGGRR